MAFQRSPSSRSILRGQTIGFSCLLAIMWIAELSRIPYHLFGDSPEFVWSRILIRTAVLLCIWLTVHLTTSRLLKRLHELEEFLRICSWCRKVGDKGEWMTVEEYFDTRFHTGTSHGICPECAQSQLAQHRATRVKAASKSQS